MEWKYFFASRTHTHTNAKMQTHILGSICAHTTISHHLSSMQFHYRVHSGLVKPSHCTVCQTKSVPKTKSKNKEKYLKTFARAHTHTHSRIYRRISLWFPKKLMVLNQRQLSRQNSNNFEAKCLPPINSTQANLRLILYVFFLLFYHYFVSPRCYIIFYGLCVYASIMYLIPKWMAIKKLNGRVRREAGTMGGPP